MRKGSGKRRPRPAGEDVNLLIGGLKVAQLFVAARNDGIERFLGGFFDRQESGEFIVDNATDLNIIAEADAMEFSVSVTRVSCLMPISAPGFFS